MCTWGVTRSSNVVPSLARVMSYYMTLYIASNHRPLIVMVRDIASGLAGPVMARPVFRHWYILLRILYKSYS